MSIDLALPADPALTAVELRQADRHSETALAGRCSVGVPIVQPLDPSGGHALTAVALPCSFSLDDEPILRAAVAVDLGEAAIAYGLTPHLLTRKPTSRPASLSFTLSLTPELTVSVGAPAETNGVEYFLVASGEGSSQPVWRFRRTEAEEIVGIHWLGMVIATPLGAGGTGRIALSASVRRKGLGIVPYRAALPERIRDITF